MGTIGPFKVVAVVPPQKGRKKVGKKTLCNLPWNKNLALNKQV